MTDTNDLPPLPDGWEWGNYEDGWFAQLMNKEQTCLCASGEVLCHVSMSRGLRTVEIYEPYASCHAQAPAEVILAVLRANGYSFTS